MRFLEEREALLQLLHHLARAIDATVQVDVFAFEVEHATPIPRNVVTRHHAAGDLQGVQFVLRFLTTAAPGRQFVGQVAEQPLEFGERLLIRSNVS
jgi:hypothetical protein